MRVLVVEDNAMNCELLQEMLTLYPCEAEFAVNGKKALEKLLASHFDLVFMDLQMPVLDGWETTKRIRANKKISPHLHIIAMTASVTEAERKKCLEVGMNDFLAKPFDFATLESLLKRNGLFSHTAEKVKAQRKSDQ